MTQILSEARAYDGILELAPQPGSEHPDISWGDVFLYYAPDQRVPRDRQPFATIVTKDYPDDTRSRLGVDGRRRLNIHVGRRLFTELVGHEPSQIDTTVAYDSTDVFLPHPLYGAHGWVCVVDPAEGTTDRALEAVRAAYLADRQRVERRDEASSSD